MYMYMYVMEGLFSDKYKNIYLVSTVKAMYIVR